MASSLYNSVTGQVELRWPVGGDAAVAKRIHERISRVAGPQSVLTNTNDIVNSTWHSLG